MSGLGNGGSIEPSSPSWGVWETHHTVATWVAKRDAGELPAPGVSVYNRMCLRLDVSFEVQLDV